MTTTYAELAERLRNAYEGSAVAPLRDGLAPDDIDGAYAVQAINTEYWESKGRKIVGRKIGLTAKAVQKQFGVDQPDFGVLFEDMQLEPGSHLMADKVMQPKVEAEIALVLEKDLFAPDCKAEDVAGAAAYACAAIEIVDSRIADWNIAFADTVADNGSSAFFVLGEDKRSVSGLDLYSCGMVMEINGAVASLGAGAACLGHPFNSAAWLASTLAKRGAGLKAGDVLMTGALGPMAPLSPGDHVITQIGGLGRAEFTYAQ